MFDNQKLYEAMQDGEPLAVFRKTTLGKVAVNVLDPFSESPQIILLEGNPKDPKNESAYEKIFTPKQLAFFTHMNRRLLELGIVIRDDKFLQKAEEKRGYEQYTDDELYSEVLDKPFALFTKLLARIDNPIVVQRLLDLAKSTNKSVKYIEMLENKLAELNQTQVAE